MYFLKWCSANWQIDPFYENEKKSTPTIPHILKRKFKQISTKTNDLLRLLFKCTIFQNI